MPLTGSALVEYTLNRHESLLSQRLIWDQYWQDIANYVSPRKAHITEHFLSPDSTQTDRLFDTTAVESNLTLGNGMLSYITPMEDAWFQWTPPRELQGDDEAEAWFSECTRIALEDLIRCNFYHPQHEFCLDRGGFGVASIFVEAGTKGKPLKFTNHEVGTFSIAEGADGTVDTYYRTLNMTPRQMAQEFGEENLSSEARGMLSDEGKKKDEQLEIIHGIEPREDYDPERKDAQNLEYRSVWIEKKTSHILEEGGYESMPALVSRYLQWDKRQGPYGWSPSWFALPDARQSNLLEQWADTIVGLRAFPRFLYPDGYEGQVQLGMGGITYYDPLDNNGALPQEWMTGADLQGVVEHATRKEDRIKRHYHVDLFNIYRDLDTHQMTAYEVDKRESERLNLFSPNFTRLTTEEINPLLERVFLLELRGNRFPDPPDIILDYAQYIQGIPVPQVEHQSKIALKLKNMGKIGFERLMMRWHPLLEMKPELLDNVNLDEQLREDWRNSGQQSDNLHDEEDVEKIREQRAEQMAAEQEAAMMMEAGKVAGGLVEKSSPQDAQAAIEAIG